MSSISSVSASKRIRIDPNIVNVSENDKSEVKEQAEKVRVTLLIGITAKLQCFFL